MSQFNYCHLIWMCHNCTKNNKINRLHERWLLLQQNDKKSSFHDLLEKDSSVSIHHRNLRALPTDIYRRNNCMAPEIVTELFPLRSQGQYNLRSWSDFALPIVRTVNYWGRKYKVLRSKNQGKYSSKYKKVDTVERFKSGIKKWKLQSCPCSLCKMYLQQIGYMQA